MVERLRKVVWDFEDLFFSWFLNGRRGLPFIEVVDPSGDGEVSRIIEIRLVVMSWLVCVVVLVESAFDECVIVLYD